MEVTKGVRVRTEFDKIFRQSDYTTSFKLALSGQLRLSKIRSFCWKFFLGVLPENQDLWPEAIRQSRQDYTNLHEKYYVDPYKADHLDVNVHNPLSTDSNSTWSKYFKNTELEKTIQQDVGRTYQEMEFFQAESTHAMMLDVLFIWSCENSDVSYRQGMHELLAVILYVLHREYLEDAEAERAAAEVAESPVRGMSAVEVINAFDSKYLVHDAYALFKNVMNQMKDFFAPAAPGDTQTEVVRKCHHIHHQLLRKYDLELYTYLERHQIEPQLYALRWVRLLLSRELHIDDAVVLWDALFASDPNFSLLDHIIVAILVFIREDLIGKDYSACLKRLFKLPSVIDIQVFVSEALQMRNPGAKALTFSTLSGGVFPAPQPAAPAPSRGFLRRGPAAQDPLSSPAQAAPRHTLPSAVAVRQYFAQKSASMDAPSTRFLNEALNRLEDDVHKLKAQQLQAGASLESIVDTLQNELLGGGSINQNNVIMALAELKQVRDLLNDHL